MRTMACPTCAVQIALPEAAAATKIRCPSCESVFAIAGEEQTLAEAISAHRAVAISGRQPEEGFTTSRPMPRPVSAAPSILPWILASVLGGVLLFSFVVAPLIRDAQLEEERAARQQAAENLAQIRAALKAHIAEPDIPKAPLQAKLDSVITGKVTYDGEPPKPRVIDAKQPKGCVTKDKTWCVDKKGGVANVVIWVEPPDGMFFNLVESDKRRTDVVVMNQPQCDYVPHVVALYPKYFDGKKLVTTGQVFQIMNHAPFVHNSKWAGGASNKAFNDTLDIGGMRELVLNPQDEPLEIGCTIHTWMYGYIWIFDNPYHAVTKDDGSYSIKNVPTDVELTVVGWHEAKKKFFTQKKTFKKGENTLDLKIKN